MKLTGRRAIFDGGDSDKLRSIYKVYSGIVKFLKVGGSARELPAPLLYSVRTHLPIDGISVDSN